jgi:hypothetical protein
MDDARADAARMNLGMRTDAVAPHGAQLDLGACEALVRQEDERADAITHVEDQTLEGSRATVARECFRGSSR